MPIDRRMLGRSGAAGRDLSPLIPSDFAQLL